ncbi:MAG: type I DNA topoisomerase [Candidatus Dormibacteria bacterium]
MPGPKKKSPGGTGAPLIIVESPSKARTLERYLGGRYSVRASLGSVRDLPKSGFGIDEEKDFEQTYVVIPGKEKTIRELKAAAKGASQVLLGTDPDREGEAISWHLAEELKLTDPLRVEFEEITRSGVEKALASPRAIDRGLVNAQVARRVIDRLVGYKISPVLWRKVKPSISAGRVQSVAVRLVCEREAEIDAFNSIEYWSIEADLEKAGSTPRFVARLLTQMPAGGSENPGPDESDADQPAGRPELPDEATTSRIMAELREASFSVGEVQRKERRRNPVAPYETSSLQQDASNRLGFSPRRAMQVAQQLYEGVELGKDGLNGLITYMRTDETRMSQEAVAAARTFIEGRYGDGYSVPRTWEKKKGKGPVDSQGAHEGIRPTDATRTPESVEPFLNPEQFRLYTLVWRRFMASQMAAALFDTTRVDVAAGRHTLRATGSILRFDGFYRVWDRESESDEAAQLPELAAGDALSMLELRSDQHFTQPPARFTEASLIKELEERGIGRPSTYAPTIETVKDRGYVKVLERRLHPTPLGKAANTFLTANFDRLFQYDFTANMEGNLDKIEEGLNWIPFMHEFNGELNKLLKGAQEADPVRPAAERTGETCPKCGEGELVKREGKFGEFVGCARYPECDYIKEREARAEPVPVGRECPDCGKALVRRMGRRGEFVGCSGYPSCKFIEKDAATPAAAGGEGGAVGEACPDCGQGHLVEKRGRFGTFLGCDRYPECKYIKSERRQREAPQPVGRECPLCKKPLVLRSSRRGPFVGCSGYPKCKFVESNSPETAEPAVAAPTQGR